MTDVPPKTFNPNQDSPKLIEGEDYYMNSTGMMVLTKSFLKRRGYCCDSGCTNCPYGKGADGMAKSDG